MIASAAYWWLDGQASPKTVKPMPDKAPFTQQIDIELQWCAEPGHPHDPASGAYRVHRLQQR